MNFARAQLIHKTDHRLRLNVPSLKNKPTTCDELTPKLQGIPAINGARINPLTGSVLVTFDGPIEEVLLDLVEEAELSTYEKRADAPKTLEVALRESLDAVLRSADFKIKSVTSGHLSLGSLLVLSLLGLGIRQSLKGVFLPSGLALFLKCYTLMQEDNRK